jgi:4-diphosphocytidyl-2-C-methyl-D-erythritol kinase
MFLRSIGTTVRVLAPAKVNLFLEVLGRRPDGYHDLATLMVAVGLFDSLELADDPSGPMMLTCDHPDLSAGPDNLVHRAADLIRRRFGIGGGARLHLRKRIPLAAGLAGGSSDAAATLAGLNRLWRLGLSVAELATLGAELGSDVSFFLTAGAGWCTGRGEVVEPLLPGRPLYLVLVCPPVGLSTAAVYRALTPVEDPVDGRKLKQAFVEGDVESLGRLLHNRLQPVAIGLRPAVARLHGLLAEQKPAGVLMSGSGTTVFALCHDSAEALRITRAMSSAREGGDLARVCVVRSCD